MSLYLLEQSASNDVAGYGQFYNNSDGSLRYRSSDGRERIFRAGTHETGACTLFPCDDTGTDESTWGDRRGRYIRLENIVYGWGLLSAPSGGTYTTGNTVRYKGWPYTIGSDFYGFIRFPQTSGATIDQTIVEYQGYPTDSTTMTIYQTSTTVAVATWITYWALTGHTFYFKYKL